MTLTGFPVHRVALDETNFRPALMATGSIPLVMSPVRKIPGAPDGAYWDGGVIDYHLDIPFTSEGEGWCSTRISWNASFPDGWTKR
jgi:hypothetical protein